MSLLQGLLAILLFLIGGYFKWRVSKAYRPLKTGFPTLRLRPLMAELGPMGELRTGTPHCTTKDQPRITDSPN